MFGKKLEDIHVDEETGKARLADALKPFEEVLATGDFIGGEQATYADFLLFGILKWMDIVSQYRPLDETSAVGEWFGRLEGSYGGHAGKVPTVRNIGAQT